MNFLSKNRTYRQCSSCNSEITKGEYYINMGLSWGGSSRGSVCVDCIIMTAETIKNNGGVIEA
jgi:hypothetical protein